MLCVLGLSRAGSAQSLRGSGTDQHRKRGRGREREREGGMEREIQLPRFLNDYFPVKGEGASRRLIPYGDTSFHLENNPRNVKKDLRQTLPFTWFTS